MKFKIEIPAEGSLTYTLEADSLEEAIEIVKHGNAEATDYSIERSGVGPEDWTVECDGAELDMSDYDS